jgi:AraC-like DNA-binding protein
MVAMVRSAALTGYAELARGLGLDAARLAAAAGLSGAALGRPDLRVPAERVARLLELSAAAAGVEDLGLRLGETRELSNLGLMGLVAREAPTLRAAVAVIARYMRLHNEALSLRLERLAGGDAWLVAPVLAAGVGRRQAVELAVAVLHRALGELFGDGWRPELVCLAHPPPRDPSRHRRVLGPRLQFDAAASGIVCARTAMERPRRAAVAARTLLSLEARAQLEAGLERAGPATAAAAARAEIAWLLPTELCSADAVAARLGLDRRTLHRRLAREGTGYAALVDGIRRDLARRQLAEGRRPLKQVAGALGFEAPSALSRWFRARFGCSPSEWDGGGGGEPAPDDRATSSGRPRRGAGIGKAARASSRPE